MTVTKLNVGTFEHSKVNANVINFRSCWKAKKFFDGRRIINNLSQRVRTEFLYKKLSWLYDETEPIHSSIMNLMNLTNF